MTSCGRTCDRIPSATYVKFQVVVVVVRQVINYFLIVFCVSACTYSAKHRTPLSVVTEIYSLMPFPVATREFPILFREAQLLYENLTTFNQEILSHRCRKLLEGKFALRNFRRPMRRRRTMQADVIIVDKCTLHVRTSTKHIFLVVHTLMATMCMYAFLTPSISILS